MWTTASGGNSPMRMPALWQQFCRSLGVELFVDHAEQEGVEIPPHASEDWARRLRLRLV